MADDNATRPAGTPQPGGPPYPVTYQQPVSAVPTPGYVPAPTAQPYYQAVPATPPSQPGPTAVAPRQTDRPKDAVEEFAEDQEPELVLVSHSSLYYWWPVWVVGYLMALFTWTNGQIYQVGEHAVRLHPSNNLGVLFFLTLFVVILISNVTVRGLASLVVILALVLTAVLLALFRAWDAVLGWVGELNVYLNQGAYFWFATLMLLTWGLTTFVFDRMSYWVIKPGQITREHFWGAGSESYDTENMSLEKRRDDLFRHWLLGLGSGDLRIHTFGGRHEEIFVPNVLFVGYKIEAIQRLIAERPAEFGHPTIK
jgi:hypothetical protein